MSKDTRALCNNIFKMPKSLVSIEHMPMIESGRLNFSHFFAAMVNITFVF